MKEIKKYVVVGGGTAGWLSANLLAAQLKDMPTHSVTLIESPTIPIIGVGEGTVPSIRKTLQKIGLPETTLFQECDATFKQSIKFVNWLDKHRHGQNNAYHHLFDYPFPFGENLADYWLAEGKGEHFADMVSFQGMCCDEHKAPKLITHPEYQGVSDYAYHFDAHKFAGVLAKHAKETFGVEHIRANVTNLKQSVCGNIEQLVLDNGAVVDLDMVIDCSGFSSYILGQQLAVPFISKSDQLFINRALTVQVPYTSEVSLPPYTISTAHQYGWIWDIGLTTRRGVGLVYDDSLINKEIAYAKLARYLGCDPEQYTVRDIPMPVGVREKVWVNNCVAIGLSQGFVEPLEATAILLADFSANLLCNKLPRFADELPAIATQFNERVAHAWLRVLDFVKLHYCISDRQDSEFWRKNRSADSIPDSLKQRLELWRYAPPGGDDFMTKFEVFDVENYLYVLYGMKYGTRSKALSEAEIMRLSQQVAQVREVALQQCQSLPSHNQLLALIQRHGMHKV
ncbi:tryptophan halogenase family protein [Pseudoalteromonas rubra]|uniref:Tryptophan halogenase n=1 Tax=Pseudoalteromonas rubra TaxID=43658 RepID=A0A0F4QYT9_9GAMM|nr:tryptophan halogenase family protein [Pseudoalteromonas rubra]KJZ11762.1 tryptophan halogenase [Pseudoalteromonas rubra]